MDEMSGDSGGSATSSPLHQPATTTCPSHILSNACEVRLIPIGKTDQKKEYFRLILFRLRNHGDHLRLMRYANLSVEKNKNVTKIRADDNGALVCSLLGGMYQANATILTMDHDERQIGHMDSHTIYVHNQPTLKCLPGATNSFTIHTLTGVSKTEAFIRLQRPHSGGYPQLDIQMPNSSTTSIHKALILSLAFKAAILAFNMENQLPTLDCFVYGPMNRCLDYNITWHAPPGITVQSCQVFGPMGDISVSVQKEKISSGTCFSKFDCSREPGFLTIPNDLEQFRQSPGASFFTINRIGRNLWPSANYFLLKSRPAGVPMYVIEVFADELEQSDGIGYVRDAANLHNVILKVTNLVLANRKSVITGPTGELIGDVDSLRMSFESSAANQDSKVDVSKHDLFMFRSSADIDDVLGYCFGSEADEELYVTMKADVSMSNKALIIATCTKLIFSCERFASIISSDCPIVGDGTTLLRMLTEIYQKSGKIGKPLVISDPPFHVSQTCPISYCNWKNLEDLDDVQLRKFATRRNSITGMRDTYYAVTNSLKEPLMIFEFHDDTKTLVGKHSETLVDLFTTDKLLKNPVGTGIVCAESGTLIGMIENHRLINNDGVRLCTADETKDNMSLLHRVLMAGYRPRKQISVMHSHSGDPQKVKLRVSMLKELDVRLKALILVYCIRQGISKHQLSNYLVPTVKDLDELPKLMQPRNRQRPNSKQN